VIKTLATKEQINHYFGGRGVKKPKASRTVRFVMQHITSAWADVNGTIGSWVLQLPMYVEPESNGRVNRHAKSARGGSQIDAVLAMLQSHLRSIDRAAISGIELTRISPRKLDAHDNLREAFKHVLDATCAWIVRGDEFNELDRKRIGRFDDQLLGTGKVTCEYYQTTHETDRHLHGIRIRLRLKSPQENAPAP
jgi:hypothetical protein